jgi:HD-GYP domain-containing protein (c-di-GMP phosphodiesterase class II)
MAGFDRQDRSGHPSGATLLRRFTVVSLGATVVVGVLFSAIAARVAEDYALRQQAHTAALYVSEFVAPRLVPQDFLSPPPARRVQFEFALHDLIGKASILRVTVWNRDGQVLYSNDRTLVGHTFPLTPLLSSALDGHIQYQLVRAAPASAPGPHLEVEVFVPVVVSGDPRPVAAYNVLVDLTDLEPALSRLRSSVRATVALGMLVLYAGLFTIVRRASRDLAHQHAALRRAFEGTVRSLANAVDARDMATADHSSRVADYAASIARTMGLSEAEAHEVQVAGFLHDLGKIGIRDDILVKQGQLTKQEWRTMRRHPLVGYDILAPVPIAERIKLAIRHSHESWDGGGYPDGLSAEQIPLAARIVAVADAYEALTTDRPYRSARDPEEAAEEIKRCAGTQFDPRVVDAFLQVWPQWEAAGLHSHSLRVQKTAGQRSS